MTDLCKTLQEVKECQKSALNPSNETRMKNSFKKMDSLIAELRKNDCGIGITRKTRNNSKISKKCKSTGKKLTSQIEIATKYEKQINKKCKKQQQAHMAYWTSLNQKDTDKFLKKCVKLDSK